MSEFPGFREVEADEAYALWHMCGVTPFLTNKSTLIPRAFHAGWLEDHPERKYWERDLPKGERFWVKEGINDAQSNG